MKFEEIKKLLDVNVDYENNVYIPNEIFEDFKTIKKQNAKQESQSNYIAFAYSYYYLIMWLYKYTKFNMGKCIDQKIIKKILGYNAEYRESNFIIKKNGLLDQMKYTETVTDYPIGLNKDIYGEVEGYEMLSDLKINKDDKEIGHDTKMLLEHYYELNGKNYSVKMPVHGFYRYPNDEQMQQDYDNGDEDGVFSDISNTHNITFETFMYCMDNDSIGTIGFYLYSYLKRMNDLHKDGYDISLEDMEAETGIKARTLDKYLDILKKYNMINCIHNQEYFCLALSEKDRMANTYRVYDYDLFNDKPVAYEKIKIMKVSEYKKVKEEEKKNVWGNIERVDISLEDLPY
ncbi:hypothetical protein [Schinkia azotoformans]|uniref:hypothetical protein n=1 Tax=Schinkia azotoformans TaxID=1454 RepID=UPI002DB78244|nr:hypothetical protein [Schinkia azotoformans]MEC1720602.1 hypothetical protein [Schinkia azotoformans]MED4411741.1 hypothetical protein [Schinkia azotoformans]